jgi:hypothetical protein
MNEERDLFDRLYPVYSLAELKALVGWGRARMRRYLENEGVKFQLYRNKIYVYWSDLQDGAPRLATSIERVIELKGLSSVGLPGDDDDSMSELIHLSEELGELPFERASAKKVKG